MARGVNKVILVGNLGQDPETRYLPDGAAVTNVNLATSNSWKDRDSGEQKERTEWHRVVFFRRLGEIAGQYLHKGSKIYVEGSLRTRQWEKEGQKHYTTEIVADEMQMLDSKGGDLGANAQSGMSNTNNSYAGNSHNPEQMSASAASGSPGFSEPPEDDFGDDIPF